MKRIGPEEADMTRHEEMDQEWTRHERRDQERTLISLRENQGQTKKMKKQSKKKMAGR